MANCVNFATSLLGAKHLSVLRPKPHCWEKLLLLCFLLAVSDLKPQKLVFDSLSARWRFFDAKFKRIACKYSTFLKELGSSFIEKNKEKKEKLQIKMKRKHLQTAITLALMLIVAIVLPVSAQWLPDASEVDVYVCASPKLVGLGQNVFISGWVWPVASMDIYRDLTLMITKPDGTTFNVTRDTYLAETVEYTLIPDQVGNWSVVLSFPGDLVHLDRLPGVSVPYYFTVQEEPIEYPPYTPLPAEYFAYPVSQANREWFRITGCWLTADGDWGGGCTNPYSTGPESPHILWKMPVFAGGLMAGEAGHLGIQDPGMIAKTISGFVAAYGRLYMAVPAYESDGNDYPMLYCYDQYSGEKLWETPLPTFNFTTGKVVASARILGKTIQIVPIDVVSAVWPESWYEERPNVSFRNTLTLWVSGGGLWHVEPFTGQVMWYQLEPALSPKYYDGAWYIDNYPARDLYSCINPLMGRRRVHAFPPNALNDPSCPSLIWQQNKTETGLDVDVICEGYLIQNLYNATNGLRKLITWDAKTGELVANGTYGGYYQASGSSPCYGQGVFSCVCADGRARGWSFKTGSLLWTSEQRDLPHGVWGGYNDEAGLGLVFKSSYDGHKYAYNATNGELVWRYFSGTDNPYNYEYSSNAPPTGGTAVSADNKVYWTTAEHTAPFPVQRGDMLYCNNATTGELLWRLPYFRGMWQRNYCGIASGMLWYRNMYDDCLYMFGKGATKTTVSYQNTIGARDSIVIEGRVIDDSPGTKENGLDVRYPDGVPAVADDGMGVWMAYLYTLGVEGPLVDLDNVTGVTVHLFASTPDGSYLDIGYATADANGYYSKMWSPPSTEGAYTIYALFEGSKSYYSSKAEVAFGVTAAPEPSPTPAPAADYTGLLYGILGGVITAIIIGLAAIFLSLRKR